jgi:alkanesulfonate monooxygenase SsuD/methylene tetrahydromethanopterin reductase-like flavin-dependent oxidoreductase (luciferase family)
MLSLIGEIGDGWIGWLNTPETFRKKVEIIRISAKSAGREPENIQTATMLPVVFPRDNEPLEKIVLNAKAYLLSERQTIESFGYKPPAFPDYQNFLISREKQEELLRLAEDVPEEYVYRCVAFGEEHCIRMIEELIEVGANQLAFINISDPSHSREIMEKLGKIMRYFESQ